MKIKKFFLCLAMLLVGLGMLAGSVAVLAEVSLVRIELKHQGGKQHGRMSFELFGIPCFWRSLDGLARVERSSYEVTERSSSGPSRQRRVDRVLFLDAQGNELVWSERTPVLNEMEPINRYLQADAIEYRFQEKHWRHFLEMIGDVFWSVVFSVLLLLVGLLLTLGASGGVWEVLTGKTWPRYSSTRRRGASSQKDRGRRV